MRIKSIRHFLRNRAGTILVAFAIMMPVLVGSVGMAMDTAQTYLVRARLGGAIDAATLAATASATDATTIQQKVQAYFTANYPSTAAGTPRNITATVNTAANTVTVSAYADYNTTFARVLGVTQVSVYRSATVQRLVGNNIELGLVLDISGSMNDDNKIVSLRSAAKSLVDTINADNTKDYYAKIAIVPYSVAVNVGNYATQARGPVLGPKVTITAATKAQPVVVTAAGHGFSNGQTVYVTGVSGMTQINNLVFTVQSATANSFALYNGSTAVNGKNYSTFKSGGTAGRVCTTPGCEYFQFTSATNTTNIFDTSTCVSERTGTYAYTDDAASTAYVGTNYPASANPCLANQIEPLTTNLTVLENDVKNLTATGSTGGQVGIGWGWYMLSPNFGYMWPSASVPAAYNTKNLHKIMVIMTDGEYNSPYCKGVISKDAASGSGNTSDHINCNSTNGDSYAQGRTLCDAMKTKGVEIYTIGLEVEDYPEGEAMMQYCATDASHFFLAESSNLVSVFQTIARNVNGLYLAK